MRSEPEWPTDDTPETTLHRFTVLRGMVIALVIETPGTGACCRPR